MDVRRNSSPLGRRRLQLPCSVASACLLLMVACTTPPPPPPPPDLSAIDERLRQLDDRLTVLERLLTNLPSPPLRSRAEIVRNIQSLEQQRADLLKRYTPGHPSVRELDLSLRLLRLQLDFLDQASRVPQ
jgi:hypothetical protein